MIYQSFSLELANEIGLKQAIILDKFYYWIKRNEITQNNYIDGKFWTYNSIRELQEKHLPYFTQPEIRNAITSLVKNGFIEKAYYNRRKNDRTSWYAFVPKTYELMQSQLNKEKHSFSLELANLTGLSSSIILQSLYTAIKKNQEKNIIYDNSVWMYNTLDGFAKLFPYFSKQTISKTLNDLIENNIIVRNKFNKENHINTNMYWYSITNYGFSILKENVKEFDNSKLANGYSKLANGYSKLANVYSKQEYNNNNNFFSQKKFLQKDMEHIKIIFNQAFQKELDITFFGLTSKARGEYYHNFNKFFTYENNDDNSVEYSFKDKSGNYRLTQQHLVEMIQKAINSNKTEITHIKFFDDQDYLPMIKHIPFSAKNQDIPQDLSIIELTQEEEEINQYFCQERQVYSSLFLNKDDAFKLKKLGDKILIICNNEYLANRWIFQTSMLNRCFKKSYSIQVIKANEYEKHNNQYQEFLKERKVFNEIKSDNLAENIVKKEKEHNDIDLKIIKIENVIFVVSFKNTHIQPIELQKAYNLKVVPKNTKDNIKSKFFYCLVSPKEYLEKKEKLEQKINKHKEIVKEKPTSLFYSN